VVLIYLLFQLFFVFGVMAFLFVADSKAADGGLKEIIAQIGLASSVVEWIVGTGDKDMECENIQDFYSMFSSTHWEGQTKDKLKAANLEHVGESGNKYDKQLSRLRQLYRVVKHNVELQEKKITSPSAPTTEVELDAPLHKDDAEPLNEAWAKRYDVTVQAWLAASDGLVGRTHREWRNKTATVPDISRCRSMTASVMPSTTEKVKIDQRMSFHYDEPAALKISTVVDYYFGLRVLAHCWAFVGNFETEEDGKKVLFMHLDQALAYADDALKATMESGLPDAAKLNWLKKNDVATRTRMMELMRTGSAAGVALKEAREHTKHMWSSERSFSGPMELDGGSSRTRGQGRSRSRAPGGSKGGKGKGKNTKSFTDGPAHRTCTTGPGEKRLCWKYNLRKCNNESTCPAQAYHLCNYQKSDGKACMGKHVRVEAHQ